MKAVLPLLFLLIFSTSCSSTKNTANDKLNGKWTMTSYSAFLPRIPDIEDGDIIWEFDTKKSTVKVQKKKPEHEFLGLKQGVYTYTKDTQKVNINGSDYFYILSDDQLKLDNNTDPRLSKDLPVILFKRQ